MKKSCRLCGTEFEDASKALNRLYCGDNCKLRVERIRKRIKAEEVKAIMPKYHCDKCGETTQLDFDPKEGRLRWAFFKCLCGAKRSGEKYWQFTGEKQSLRGRSGKASPKSTG